MTDAATMAGFSGVRNLQKKPVIIQGIMYRTWTGPGGREVDNSREVMAFAGGGLKMQTIVGGAITIPTLEGAMRLTPGSWLVRGVKGELYPVRHDILMETYDDRGPA